MYEWSRSSDGRSSGSSNIDDDNNDHADTRANSNIDNVGDNDIVVDNENDGTVKSILDNNNEYSNQ